MYFIKLTLLMVSSCLLMAATATPVPAGNSYGIQLPQNTHSDVSRHVRSPEGGSIGVGLKKDQFGREASVNYNHNLFTSKDGRGTVDAYAQGSRNFDHNRNDFGGGIRGSWRF